MTLGADFDADVLLGGTGLNHFAARTTNGSLRIVGMDAFLHAVHLFLPMVKGHTALTLQLPGYDITLGADLQAFFYFFQKNAAGAAHAGENQRAGPWLLFVKLGVGYELTIDN